MRIFNNSVRWIFIGSLFLHCSCKNYNTNQKEQPNILMVILDDHSYPYASAYGSEMVRTPAFDQVAESGVCFTNAFVTSPGCSPSRASLLTGRFPWQIEEAGTHASSFPAKYITYTTKFEQAGYKVGFTGKGWGPGDWKISGRLCNPAGYEYNEVRLSPPTEGISKIDYTANFSDFLNDRKANEPFCFWVGIKEPHRIFEEGSALRAGSLHSDAEVPGYLPDVKEVQSDILDYGLEIEWADKHLGNILTILEEQQLLENTIIIVTADNGMAFPRAKSNCYEAGVHVPLVIDWGNKISHRIEKNVFSTVHLMPTLLEAAQIDFSNTHLPMEGSSILEILLGNKLENPAMGVAYSGRERHTSARFNNLGYPIRAMRTNDYLIIRNFEADRWPAGDTLLLADDGQQLRPIEDVFCDIDGSPTKQYLIQNRDKEKINNYYQMAVEKRPEWELYNIKKDPDCLVNLSRVHEHRSVFKSLSNQMNNYLIQTQDPRMMKDTYELYETYPRLRGKIRNFLEEK